MSELVSRRVLRVDLTDRTVESERVPDRWLRDYIGGKGLGARYLYAELLPGIDPLGPENVLLFMLGPLTGLLPGEQRYAAVTKSPLTGAFLDSYSGGSFPGTLAGALENHLGVLVTGVADEPVRLVVEDGTATIEAAAEWGMDAVETAEAFPNAAVACIGPAGERSVTYSTIASDGGDHHAGRGGAGAVMGSKRLKAVVARGEPPEGLERLRDAYAERFADDDAGRWLAASGTLESVDFANETGVLATRGWQDRQFEGADDIGIESARAAASEREYPDKEANTSMAGGFRIETAEGESVPRGATPMTLGAGLGIDEFDAVAALGGLCDRLGMDVISAGSAVAWAIRARQEGLIDRDIEFGDADGARTLLEEITARSTPLGDALADGVDAVAAQYGGDELIPTIKRMELPAYDPRDAPSMALAYATSDRGACHRRSRPVEREAFAAEPWEPADAARAVVESQNTRSVLWSLIADDFVGEVLWEDLGAEWLTAVGIEYTPDELRMTGERIWNLTRLFNVREGFSREDDVLPALLGDPDGDTDARVDPELFERMITAYYEFRGWDDAGHPTEATLERLGLDDVVDADTPVGSSSSPNPTRRD